MKVLYLHIGTAKTGTSALQAFLQDNHEVLQKKGYCYQLMPFHYNRIADVRNAHFLLGRVTDAAGETDREKTKQRGKEAYEILKQWFSKYDNVILTDEGIWNFLSTRNVIKELASFCKDNNICLKVIVYLRRQDDYLASLWKQKVRRKGLTASWEQVQMTPPKKMIVLDYYAYLKKLIKVVGKENIIVRRYERGRFQGNGNTIFSDFLDAVGIEFTEEFQIIQEQKNTSLTNNFAEIKRITNQLLSENVVTAERENDFLERVAVACSQIDKKEIKSSMFSREERYQFMMNYTESNNRVAEEFLGEKELFSLDGEELPKWTSDNQQQYEDTLLFVGKALLEQKKEIDMLKRKVENIQNNMSIRKKVTGMLRFNR